MPDVVRGVVLALVASFPCLVHTACEPHCAYPCWELNGPLHMECGDCTESSGFKCFPGAVDFDTWKERAEALGRVGVNANGEQTTAVDPKDPDAPIELTHKSMVMRDKFYAIASKKRTAEFGFDKLADNPALAEFLELPPKLPEDSPRQCEVHSCVLVDGDDACAEGRPDCAGPRGHLRQFGEQMDVEPVIEHDVTGESPLADAPYFWREHITKYEPVVLRGAAAQVMDLTQWSDEALLGSLEGAPGTSKCTLDNGRPWYVTVEQNNRISHNDRWPLVHGWDFCKFLREYRKPDAPAYCIHSITEDKRVALPREIGLPRVLSCDELVQSMHAVRMWMSRGNTTSSQHFDTHDNLMLQVDGTKDIYLSHPNESAAMYMDHFDKFGLSPINVDRVDLQRFPKFADARVQHAQLRPGDALYIPDGYWHVIKSTGRNIALAFEFGPQRHGTQAWTAEMRQMNSHPGVLWAEQRRLLATALESRARSGSATITQCTRPLEQPLRSLADFEGWEGPHD